MSIKRNSHERQENFHTHEGYQTVTTADLLSCNNFELGSRGKYGVVSNT
jgi:hypothetical protein